MLQACSGNICYPEINYSNFTNFPAPDYYPLPEDYLLLEKVYDCLKPLNHQWLAESEAKLAECLSRPHIELRSCLKVGVAPTWRVSSCTGEQVFPCNIGPERCLEKGETPTAECPCMCRAQIQDETTIWVTPNRKLLAAYAVTMMTGCLNPWTPSLAPCSNIYP